MLGDTAGFAAGHVGFADGIEQRSFAVIDVAHDGDHGRAAHEIFRFFGFFDILRAFLFVGDLVGGSAELARQIFGQLYVESLVDGGENSSFRAAS